MRTTDAFWDASPGGTVNQVGATVAPTITWDIVPTQEFVMATLLITIWGAFFTPFAVTGLALLDYHIRG